MNAPESKSGASADLLSAYLDGELDEPGRERVEQLLASDASARQELARLREAWELLDRLPKSEVNVSFTQTTVEMVALASVSQDEPTRFGLRRWIGPLVLLIAIVAAAGTGFAIGRFAWPDPNEQLLRDLPLVEHLDAYQQAGSLDFVRQLDQEKLFSDAGGGP